MWIPIGDLTYFDYEWLNLEILSMGLRAEQKRIQSAAPGKELRRNEIKEFMMCAPSSPCT